METNRTAPLPRHETWTHQRQGQGARASGVGHESHVGRTVNRTAILNNFLFASIEKRRTEKVGVVAQRHRHLNAKVTVSESESGTESAAKGPEIGARTGGSFPPESVRGRQTKQQGPCPTSGRFMRAIERFSHLSFTIFHCAKIVSEFEPTDKSNREFRLPFSVL